MTKTAASDKVGEFYLDIPEVHLDTGDVNIEAVGFAYYDDGIIHCKVDNTAWCDHIQYLMASGTQGDNVAWTICNGQTRQLQLPMFPTLNVFVNLLLVPERLNTVSEANAIQVSYIDANDVAHDLETQLGYLNLGEGLFMLRSMLVASFDIWEAMHPDYQPQCKSHSHSFKAQMNFERNMRTPRFAFREKYCVWATGNCSTCQAGEMDFDFDDFVPERENKSRNPFR